MTKEFEDFDRRLEALERRAALTGARELAEGLAKALAAPETPGTPGTPAQLNRIEALLNALCAHLGVPDTDDDGPAPPGTLVPALPLPPGPTPMRGFLVDEPEGKAAGA